MHLTGIFSIVYFINIMDNLVIVKQIIILLVECKEYLMSFVAQERLWFIEQYEQGTNAYHIPTLLELNNNNDINIFKDSFKYLFQRP